MILAAMPGVGNVSPDEWIKWGFVDVVLNFGPPRDELSAYRRARRSQPFISHEA